MSEKSACVVHKEKMVDTEQGSLEYKQYPSSWSLLQLHLNLAWIFGFFFFFLSFIYSNKRCGISQSRHQVGPVDQHYQSIKVLLWQNWCWCRGKIAMNVTEYLNSCEYGPSYMKVVHTMAPRCNFALIFPINVQLSSVQ